MKLNLKNWEIKMIKLFRHIRKPLLMENKTSKYFKYAIGEIVLVMVGILLALQMNNWNEGNKSVVQEIKILKEIRFELIDALDDLNDDIDDLDRNLNSSKIIYNSLLLRENYHDSLNIHFMLMIDNESFTAKTSAFESLQSLGLEIISNDSIRQSITSTYLYIARFKDYESELSRDITKLKNLIEPYLIIDREFLISNPSLTSQTRWGIRNIPFKFTNYENFLNNEQIVYTVLTSIQSKYLQNYLIQRFEKGMVQVIANIEEELNILENK